MSEFSFLSGMLIYRYQRTLHKRRLKFIHAGIMIFVVLLTIIAQIAAFDSHNLAPNPIPNLYSLHSWLGLTTIILYCCQVCLKSSFNLALLKKKEMKNLKSNIYNS